MKGEMAILGAALLFGLSATVVRILEADLDPVYLAALFDLVAGAAVLVIYFALHRKKPFPSLQRHDLTLLFGIVVSGGIIAPLLFNVGLFLSNPSTTALLMNTEAMFTILLAFIVLKERLHAIEYTAMSVILFCAVVVSTNLDLSSISLEQLGSLLVILSAMCWGIDNTVSKLALARMDILFIFLFKTLVGGSILLGFTVLAGIALGIPISTLPFMVLSAILTLGISLLLFLYGLKLIGAMRTAVIFATSALFGTLVAVVVLDDFISPLQAAAGGVMFMTIVYLTWVKEHALQNFLKKV